VAAPTRRSMQEMIGYSGGKGEYLGAQKKVTEKKGCCLFKGNALTKKPADKKGAQEKGFNSTDFQFVHKQGMIIRGRGGGRRRVILGVVRCRGAGGTEPPRGGNRLRNQSRNG